MQSTEIVVNNIVGDQSDPAAQSRAIASGLNKVGQLLRIGANALEENEELKEKLDPMVQVKCPFCSMTASVRQSKAAAEVAGMAQSCYYPERFNSPFNPINQKEKEITRLNGLVSGLRGDVARLETDLRSVTDQRDSLLKTNSSEAFRARLVAKMEKSYKQLLESGTFGSKWVEGYNSGYGVALSDVQLFEKVRPNEALVPPPSPATVPATEPTLKPGMKVRCVDNSGARTGLEEGHIYTVKGPATSPFSPGNITLEEIPTNTEIGYYPHRFEIVGEKLTLEDCKPGVKVVYVDDNLGYNAFFTRGNVYTIKEACPAASPENIALLNVIDNSGAPRSVFARRFVLAPSSGATPAVLDEVSF